MIYSIEPIVTAFGSEFTIIDLGMLQDEDITPATEDLVHLPAPAAKTNPRFHLEATRFATPIGRNCRRPD